MYSSLDERGQGAFDYFLIGVVSLAILAAILHFYRTRIAGDTVRSASKAINVAKNSTTRELNELMSESGVGTQFESASGIGLLGLVLLGALGALLHSLRS